MQSCDQLRGTQCKGGIQLDVKDTGTNLEMLKCLSSLEQPPQKTPHNSDISPIFGIGVNLFSHK